MRKYKQVMKREKVCISITCNKCGEVQDHTNSNTSIEFIHTFGFFSPKGWDLKQISFDLCEKCVILLLKRFKIKPIIINTEIS